MIDRPGALSVCLFCGASGGGHPVYVEAARALGRGLAGAGCRLVYGGSRIGLMGAAADAALSVGGAVVGVIPQLLIDREVAHPSLSELHVVDSMHARKTRMAELSQVFVALPGGYGTLDELCEMLTWSQLGLHEKPVLVVDVNGYFASLMAFFDHAVAQGFVSAENRARLVYLPDVASALQRIAAVASSGAERREAQR